MPELPEVEVTRLGLVDRLRGAQVTAVRLGKPLRWPLGCATQQLVGRRVHDAARRGKYLWLALDDGGLLLHLGMSGSLNLSEHPGDQHHHHREPVRWLGQRRQPPYGV